MEFRWSRELETLCGSSACTKESPSNQNWFYGIKKNEIIADCYFDINKYWKLMLNIALKEIWKPYEMKKIFPEIWVVQKHVPRSRYRKLNAINLRTLNGLHRHRCRNKIFDWITCWFTALTLQERSRKGNSKLYPVQNKMASASTSEPSHKTNVVPERKLSTPETWKNIKLLIIIIW